MPGKSAFQREGRSVLAFCRRAYAGRRDLVDAFHWYVSDENAHDHELQPLVNPRLNGHRGGGVYAGNEYCRDGRSPFALQTASLYLNSERRRGINALYRYGRTDAGQPHHLGSPHHRFIHINCRNGLRCRALVGLSPAASAKRIFINRILAALVLGAAICAMHYTGMRAAQFSDMAHTLPGGISELGLSIGCRSPRCACSA